MNIRELQEEIKKIVPESGLVKVEHTYINNICGEGWAAQLYRAKDADAESLDEVMFMVSSTTPEEMIEKVREMYAAWCPPDPSIEIDKLKKRLVELYALQGPIKPSPRSTARINFDERVAA